MRSELSEDNTEVLKEVNGDSEKTPLLLTNFFIQIEDMPLN